MPKFLSRKLAFAAAGVVAVVIGFRFMRAQTGTPSFPAFGDPTKARFYQLQTNPQSADGGYVLALNSAQVYYPSSSPLLTSTDLTDAIVINGSGGTYSVEVGLAASGVSTLQNFVNANGSAAPVVLVWQTTVYSLTPASAFNLNGGPTIVATGLDAADAAALSTALTTP